MTAILKDTAPNFKITPMLRQYLDMQDKHQGCIILFRLGDFYEVFFEAAEKVAGAIGIQLTKRHDIPMCGIPWHQLDNYLPRLMNAGFKIALCEQLETPAEAKARGSKSGVLRDVVRVISPGTITEESLLNQSNNNYLCSISKASDAYAIAWIDMSTGQFHCLETSLEDAFDRLNWLRPAELVISHDLMGTPSIKQKLSPFENILTVEDSSYFLEKRANAVLDHAYDGQAWQTFDDFTNAELSAAGGILHYVQACQKGSMPTLKRLQQYRIKDALQIDAATTRNLELFQTLSGSSKGSLLSAIDKTQTAIGSRLLKQHLSSPLTDQNIITQRHNVIDFWIKNTKYHAELKEILSKITDAERVLSRLSLNRASPRDLGMMYQFLNLAEKLAVFLSGSQNLPQLLIQAKACMPMQLGIMQTLENALTDELPNLVREGGFIKTGFHIRLDELRGLQANSKRLILELEKQYQTNTGINNLKIKFNNVIGYFIEVKPQYADTLKEPFRHRQSMANAIRFSTDELDSLHQKLLTADTEALAIEQTIFNELVTAILAETEIIRTCCDAIAYLDVSSSLATLAQQHNWTQPQMFNDTRFHITAGRHPVVENSLTKSGKRFIANDCDLNDDSRAWLLTGPNMAGKSTFLRQNAVIVLLAQMGSYVPAKSAEIGLCDKIFSRVGAADDLARGHSTFMVEMVETSSILHHATDQSLVILDEIGRGTATYDGLSLAWSILEYIHDHTKCRTLFATHYHELDALTSTLKALKSHHFNAAETAGNVVFLHNVKPGAAKKSYGILVAKLAGLPPSVLRRAESLLKQLEQNANPVTLDGLPLFTGEDTAPEPAHPPIIDALETLDVDSLTPRDALDLLYKWKAGTF